jgi:uncharacterized membrane protein
MRTAPVLLLALLVASPCLGDDPPTRLRVVTPKPVGILASAINGAGDVVGFEWRENAKNPEVIDEVPFLARGGEMTDLPLLEGYTATFPHDLSDDGVVVGRVSKPAPLGQRVILRNQAFVWDARGGIRGLGAAPDDWISTATGISRDGRRIVGYTLGDRRQRPCVWERGEGDAWAVRVLPNEGIIAPWLAISDDGRLVAGSDGSVPCLWTLGEDGAWTREAIGEPGSLAPRAVNNAGMVVGLRHTFEGRNQAVVWTRADGIQRLPLPDGFVKAEAHDVNNAGIVVGMIDGPGGSDIGPRAFAFERGELRVLDEAGPAFGDATAINDRGEVAGVFESPEHAEP